MKTLNNYINNILENVNNIKYADAILVSPNNEILILKRSYKEKLFKRKWCFPGGTYKTSDYTTKNTVIREIKEETGIELSLMEQQNMILFKEQKNNDNSVSYIYLIKLDNKYDIKLSKEHVKYKWYTIKDDNIKYKEWIPKVYQSIQEYYQE